MNKFREFYEGIVKIQLHIRKRFYQNKNRRQVIRSVYDKAHKELIESLIIAKNKDKAAKELYIKIDCISGEDRDALLKKYLNTVNDIYQ